MTDIPDRIQGEVTDCAVSYIGALCDMMIQMELELDHRLDDERLARAVELTFDAEPVLGCRFVKHPKMPYWERLKPDERAGFRPVADDAQYEAFKIESLDETIGPQVKAFLQHTSNGDRLLIKVGHIAADAGATKEVVGIISSIYTRLGKKPDFRPEPNVRGSRSIHQVLDRVPWYAYPRIYLNYWGQEWAKNVPPQSCNMPVEKGPPGRPVFVLRHLSEERVKRMAAFGRKLCGAKINDLFITAMLRAMARLGERGNGANLRLMTTVDLRRYLPGGRGEGICNLSAIVGTNLGTEIGNDFSATLERVTAQTRRGKAFWYGLHDYVGLIPVIAHVPYVPMKKFFNALVRFGISKGSFSSGMTNLGPILKERVTFDAPARRAWLLPPPTYPPAVITALSGYRGTLTFSAGVHPQYMRKVSPDKIFDAILNELPT